MKSNYISKGIIMLLALAGSNYSYAQQATVVVNNPTDAQRQELVEVNISDVKAKLAGIAPKKGEAYNVNTSSKTSEGSRLVHRLPTMANSSSMPASVLMALPPTISASASHIHRRCGLLEHSTRCERMTSLGRTTDAPIVSMALPSNVLESVLSAPTSGRRTHQTPWYMNDM